MQRSTDNFDLTVTQAAIALLQALGKKSVSSGFNSIDICTAIVYRLADCDCIEVDDGLLCALEASRGRIAEKSLHV